MAALQSQLAYHSFLISFPSVGREQTMKPLMANAGGSWARFPSNLVTWNEIFFFFIFSTAGYTRWNICLVTHIGSLVQPELFKIYLFCLKEGWLFSYQSCRNAEWHKGTPKTEISFFVNPSQTFSVEIISPWLFPQHLTQIHIIPSPFFSPFASQLSDLLLYHPPVFPRLSFSLSSGLPSHPSPLPSLSAFCSHKKVR